MKKLRSLIVLLLVACGGRESPSQRPNPTPAQVASVLAAVSAARGHGLPPDAIRQVVLRHQGSLRRCYDIELSRMPDLGGRVTMAWTIAPDGTVSSASVASSTIRNTNVESCVLAVVKSWTFPTSDGPTDVAAYPFKFGVADAGARDAAVE